MSSSNFNVLRQLAVAADVPSFVRLASSKAFGALICKHPEDEFRRLQRQGYSALVFAALAKGLQLHNSTAASAAGSQDRRPAVSAPKELQGTMDGLGSLAVAATDVVVGCLMMWGEGSREANNMGQELLDSGVHAQAQDVAQPLPG
jgi:hypothetical protein